MRCSYCREEVVPGAVSCPHCTRACLQRVDYDRMDDRMSIAEIQAAAERVGVAVEVRNRFARCAW